MVGEESTEEEICKMRSHLTDAKKILASVARIVDNGNRVVFDSGAGMSFIQNKRTGRKIDLIRDKNVFVIDAKLLDGGGGEGPGRIIADSGAAENVMPKGGPPTCRFSRNNRG